MPHDGPHLKICLIAGEASGDALGARLMAALQEGLGQTPEFIGVGGDQMRTQGLQSLFPMNELSVMGIVEVLPRLPLILRRIKQTVSMIEAQKPDLVITIDSPDFCFRVIKSLRDRGNKDIKAIHYVAPTVWAWRPERAQKVAALYNGIMCLYPIEPEYFTKEGMDAAFTGHSVLESGYDKGDAHTLRNELGIPGGAQVLGILFGSRMGELNRVGPVLRGAAEQLAARNPDMHIIAPTLPHLRRPVKNLLERMPCKTHVVHDTARKWDCFAAMDKAIATSGTVGLELAVASVPHVIGYKMNLMTWRIVKKKVNVKYAHLANILLDRQVVPEFIQGDCKASSIAAAVDNIDIKLQHDSFAQVRSMLAGERDSPQSKQAAQFAAGYLRSLIST